MKIGIDARFLTHPQMGGFKTYTANLVTALAAVDNQNQYVLYLDRPSGDNEAVPQRPNVVARVVPGNLPVVGMPWREQVELVRQAAADGVDLFHAPCLTAPLRLRCPLVVTIHDMIWLLPHRLSRGGAWSFRRRLMDRYYRSVPRWAARRAAAVITVSRAAKDSIVEQLGLDARRVTVTYEAPAPSFRRIADAGQIEAARRRHGLESGFILAIGSADPRKNLQTLVAAFALLPQDLRARYRLVIVWTHSLLAPTLNDTIQSLGLKERVRCLERVSDADLVLLFNAASVFVFPSLYEGFGLPPLEAMACGTAVVASNNSSIPEVLGDAALLVDGEDRTSIANAMARVLTDADRRATLIERGLQRVGRFSWEKCARETLKAYEGALSAGRQ